MPQHPIFDISPDQIAAIDPEGLRLLVAELCKADLRHRGLSTSAVHDGGSPIATDGGIDVRVELPADTDISGFIPRPVTVFQAKADDMRRGKIADEMRPRTRGADKREKPPLRDSIRALAAVGGAYVIVCSKGSTTPLRLDQRRAAMRDAVADLPKPDSLHLEFYDRTRLADWVRHYPGVVLWVRERIAQPVPGWQPLDNWSHAPEGAEMAYLSDDTARIRDQRNPQDGALTIAEGIARLRAALSRPSGVVRLTGLSGTGKTRLLEALFDDRIGVAALDSAHAVYTDMGHEPQPRPQQLASRLIAQNKRAVLVIDNCRRDTHDALVPLCRATGSPISLITVELDIGDDQPEGTECFVLQHASTAVIASLLERGFRHLSPAICWCIAEFSDGNARIAILAAENVRPDANLADLTDQTLFERLFHQKRQPDATLLRAAEALSLVYSFDCEKLDGDGAELPFLAGLARLDPAEVYEQVAELRRRGIIQSRGPWRAILPQPIATRLAKRALQNRPPLQLADRFWNGGNPRLLRSFTHRLSYLHDSPEVQAIASAWLGPEGPLANSGWMERDRIDVLKNLAPVDPAATLALVEQFVQRVKSNQGGNVAPWHRGTVMQLLRQIAHFAEHFIRASFLLGRLVSVERVAMGRPYNASFFTELFQIGGAGSLAGSAPRLEVIESLLADTDDANRETGMIGLGEMLRVPYPRGGSHDLSFGARVMDDGWVPRTSSDYRDWYGCALVVAKRLALSDSTQRTAARRLISQHFHYLWRRGEIVDILENALLDIGADEHWPEGWLAVRKTLGMYESCMDPNQIARLRGLAARLAPHDLLGRIRSYVLTPLSQIADFDYRETANEARDVSVEAVGEARRLGVEAGKTPDAIDALWSDLCGPDAHQALWFGQGFAESTESLTSGWSYLAGKYGESIHVPRNPSILAGFLSTASTIDKPLVDRMLSDAVHDPVLGMDFPRIQIFVGVDQVGVTRLLDAIRGRLAPATEFSGLWMDWATESIAPSDLSRILSGIAKLPDGLEVAAGVLARRFDRAPAAQRNWDPCLLELGRKFLRDYPLDRVDHATDYRLHEIAKVCLTGPDASGDAVILLNRILQCSDSLPIDAEFGGLIQVLFALHPFEALDCWLAQATDSLSSWTMNDIGTLDTNPLSKVPTRTLMEWASMDPGVRFALLARLILPFVKENGRLFLSEVASALMAEAPDRASVLAGLASQIRPESGFVSSADSLQEQRAPIQDLFNDQDLRIRELAKELDRSIAEAIAAARLRETDRDERFER